MKMLILHLGNMLKNTMSMEKIYVVAMTMQVRNGILNGRMKRLMMLVVVKRTMSATEVILLTPLSVEP